MSYTPPAAHEVNFDLVSGYTPPASGAVDFHFWTQPGTQITKAWDGVAWQPVSIKVYQSGVWVDAALKLRSNGQWL